jgi:hypothetical protein
MFVLSLVDLVESATQMKAAVGYLIVGITCTPKPCPVQRFFPQPINLVAKLTLWYLYGEPAYLSCFSFAS